MKTVKLTIGKENFEAFLKAVKQLNDAEIIIIKILDEYDTPFDNKRLEISYTTESNLFYLGILTQLYSNLTFSEQ